mmetsp:Transcript_35589/g.99503  ORF Transcript_35589/g.99503 Transcript_35589/m.99503 type:complete len:158 (+) Transcript_35589:68-541(+)
MARRFAAAAAAALLVAPSAGVKVDPPSAAALRGLVAAGRASHVGGAEAAACAAARAEHRPKQTDSLAEYKDEAQGCLTWCGQFKANCFAGCKDDCVGYLGAPPCAAFVMDTDGCKAPCDQLTDVHKCLVTVQHNSTETCHSKFGGIAVPASGCEYAA